MSESVDLRARVAQLENELQTLREREQDLSDFIENASLGLHWVGPDGIILWANQAELKLLGYHREEYIGHHIAEFHVDKSASDDILKRLHAKETLHSYEARMRCRDGSIKQVLINSNVRWAGDRFVHTRCFTRDITEYKRAEEEIRDAQQMLRGLVDSSPLPIVVFTPDGKVRIWNAAAERVFGWHAAEIVGQPIPFSVEDRIQVRQGETVVEREIVLRRKDGQSVELGVATAPLRDAAGNIAAIMSVYLEITDRKRYERRLWAQYAVADTLTNASSVAEAAPKLLKSLCSTLGWHAGVFWMRREGEEALRCTAFWPSSSQSLDPFQRMCRDYTFAPGNGLPGRILASKKPSWIADLTVDHNFPRIQAAAESGLRSGFGFPILLGDTIFGAMEFFSQDVRTPDEDLLRITTAIGYQIGEFVERQRAQRRLADREESYRVITEAASDGIISVDRTSTILFANSAAAGIFGYTREELLGADLTILMPDYLRHAHRAAVDRYLTTGHRHMSWTGVALPGLRKDGREIPLEVSFAEYQQDNQHVFIGILRDITERKRIEEHLRQTAKLESLGVLAGGVAHDFNNLLTGILGNSSLAVDMLAPESPVRRMLEDVVNASERAAQLTRQLLAYAGKGRFVIEPLDLSKLVVEIGHLIRTSIPRSVVLRLELADNLPPVDADAAQMQQLIMNLVINGAEAIGEGNGGTVLVTTGTQHVDETYIRTAFIGEELRTGDYVSLEVQDTGSGMDEPTIARIFDPFFTTKFTGRGLGLAAALGIVRGHKAALKVYSAPGKGTTFKVLFPASEGGSRRAEPVVTRSAAPGVGTVLVVDDEDIVRGMVKNALERYGYTVLLAENGKEAIDVFRPRSSEVAVVLLDMTMPVMGGEEALQELKTIRPDVKVILTSGFNEVEATQRFKGKGLSGFIQKPYTSSALRQKIHEVLSQ